MYISTGTLVALIILLVLFFGKEEDKEGLYTLGLIVGVCYLIFWALILIFVFVGKWGGQLLETTSEWSIIIGVGYIYFKLRNLLFKKLKGSNKSSEVASGKFNWIDLVIIFVLIYFIGNFLYGNNKKVVPVDSNPIYSNSSATATPTVIPSLIPAYKTSTPLLTQPPSQSQSGVRTVEVFPLIDGREGYWLLYPTNNKSACIWTWNGGSADIPYQKTTVTNAGVTHTLSFPSGTLNSNYNFKVVCGDAFGNQYSGVFQ